jgi:hypothetical protein
MVRYAPPLFQSSHAAPSQAFGSPVDAEGGADPWFVRSLPKSQDHYSKLAKHQEVSATPRASYANVWTVLDPDPMARPRAEGEPVPVRRPPSCIMHQAPSIMPHAPCVMRRAPPPLPAGTVYMVRSYTRRAAGVFAAAHPVAAPSRVWRGSSHALSQKGGVRRLVRSVYTRTAFRKGH